MTDRRSVVNGGADPSRSGRCLRWGRCPRRCTRRWCARPGTASPPSAFEPEVVDVPPIGAGRGPRRRDGGRHQLQQRLGRPGLPGRPGRAAPEAGRAPRTSTSVAATCPASSTPWATASTASPSATTSSSTTATGIRTTPGCRPGKDPMMAPSARIWGYDTNYGSFGQFSRVQGHQILPKADHLTWEEAAAPTLVGTTAYRMLFGWAPTRCSRTTSCSSGAAPAAWGRRRSSWRRTPARSRWRWCPTTSAAQYAQKLGAVGWINRTDYDHWGIPPRVDDAAGQKAWSASARAFGKKLSEILGERRDPAIVFEHPGQDTIPTSIYLCATGGMVVICAGTTGYDAVVDLRYHWTRQKRLQGSHGTNDEQARAYNELVRQEAIDPCLGQAPAVHGDPCRPRGDGPGRRGLRQRGVPGRRGGARSGQRSSEHGHGRGDRRALPGAGRSDEDRDPPPSEHGRRGRLHHPRRTSCRSRSRRSRTTSRRSRPSGS